MDGWMFGARSRAAIRNRKNVRIANSRMQKGSFKRQVEVGRVVLLPEEGNKLAVIVDIVDHKRVSFNAIE